MNDDLGTPAAVAVLHNAVREGNQALDADDRGQIGRHLGEVNGMLMILGLNADSEVWKTDSHRLTTVVDALIKTTRKLPLELYKSLTWDRGKEMAAHKRFTLATDIKVYFCDPRSPWQRGSNENTNGLLRQYLPKGIDISSYSQAKLNAGGPTIEREAEEDTWLPDAG